MVWQDFCLTYPIFAKLWSGNFFVKDSSIIFIVDIEQNNSKLSDKARNKIALLMLVLLIGLVGFAFFMYFKTVTPFTQVATNVDDNVGDMGRYSTIVYSGIRTPSKDYLKAEELLARKKLKKLYVSDVRNIYDDKNSDVTTIDLQKILKQVDPEVYICGNKKIGIFSINCYLNKTYLYEKTNILKKQGAEIIICVCPRTTMISDYSNINVVIATQNKSPQEEPEGMKGNCLIVRSALSGNVGVIHFSNSNVATSKEFSSTDIDDIKKDSSK